MGAEFLQALPQDAPVAVVERRSSATVRNRRSRILIAEWPSDTSEATKCQTPGFLQR